MNKEVIKTEIDLLKVLAQTKTTPAEFVKNPKEWAAFLFLINKHAEQIEKEIKE